MNFIGYFEFDPKDFDDIIPLFQKAMAVREKEPARAQRRLILRD